MLSFDVIICLSVTFSLIVCTAEPFARKLPDVGLGLPALLAESRGETSSEKLDLTFASARVEDARGWVPIVADVRLSL